jgi:hypothetical protein
MYLRRLHVQNVKLLRDVEIDFTNADGSPRMWTVFVGENRLCKTTLLQTIAVAASGRDMATHLATDVIESWPDLRRAGRAIAIEAAFGFSSERHADRLYFGKDSHDRSFTTPPILHSELRMEAGRRLFDGGSSFFGKTRDEVDALVKARNENLAGWLVAGYGTNRLLRASGSTDTSRRPDPALDRVRPLFGADLIGTGFLDLLSVDLAKEFAKILQAVFVDGALLPAVTHLELRGRGGIRSTSHLIDSQRFEMDILGDDGKRIRVPATWLSQGYQSVIAWLADVVGQIFLEAGEAVPAAEMEGVVLVDEIDLHLHPTWQVQLVPALKKVFPRLQFIATTHSPMVLPALTAEEVFILSRDDDGSVVATQSRQSPALLTGTEILESFFSLPGLYPTELAAKVQSYGRLANDPTRSAADDTVIASLRVELASAGVEFDWEPVPRASAS